MEPTFKGIWPKLERWLYSAQNYSSNMNVPKPGEVYLHHKGGKYIVVAVGMDVTGDRDIKIVIYTPVDRPNEYYTRRLANFLGVLAVTQGNVSGAVSRKPRFQLIPGSMK
jgi:hypothetical protein